MAHPGIAAEQAVLITALLAAFALALLYLRRRGHLRLLSGDCWLPALLIVAFSLPDALVTLSGTWNAPSREANPFVGIFLTWAGWRGLCLALLLWILGWTLVLDGLETLRLRLPPHLAPLVRTAQLFLLYALAMGHLDGFSAWTHVPAAFYAASNGLLALLRQHAAWTMPSYALAYVLYPALIFGALCAAAHALLITRGRITRGRTTRGRHLPSLRPA
jgi:hypothetical protein